MATIIDSASQDIFQVKESKSKNGNTYESGTRPGDSSQVVTSSTKSLEGVGTQVAVQWPVDNQWHAASEDLNSKLGIASYIVGNSSYPYFDYYVEFTTSRALDYYFTDESGDSYENKVSSLSGSHITRYKSKKPTIVLVSGN